MSDVKMGDLLDLPYGRVSKNIFGDKSANNLLSLIDGTQYQVEYICTAINSYDSNQELIAKQVAQIEQLREALAGMLDQFDSEEDCANEADYIAVSMSKKALAAKE